MGVKLDPRIKNYLDHTWGPIIGVILNILVVYLMVRFVVFETKERQAEISVTITDPVETDLEDFEEELELLDEMPEMENMDIPTDVPIEMEAPPEVDTMAPATETATDFAALDIQTASSPLVMKGLYSGRSSSGRKAALGKYGGKWGRHTEQAVQRALKWLKENQEPNGSWKKNTDAMTGLAILTFLAHGETPASEEYGETVTKAIQYLISRQQKDGQIGGGGHKVYPHSIATYALAEAYSLTRIPMIKPVLEKAVEHMLRGQQATGMWDYDWKKGSRLDTSVTGWMVQALKAAYMAGVNVPGLKASMEKAAEGLKTKVYNPETGAFGYTGPQTRNDSMTGVATLALQLLGEGGSSEVRGGIKAMRMLNCDWDAPDTYSPLYAWYYITQAKFHQGGTTWSSWNNRFAAQYVRNQHEDGHWSFPNGKETGASPGGDVYSTCLASLTLMVYYRHLPSYQKVEAETEVESTDDDVVIKIM
jgi:hypothetical protein